MAYGYGRSLVYIATVLIVYGFLSTDGKVIHLKPRVISEKACDVREIEFLSPQDCDLNIDGVTVSHDGKCVISSYEAKSKLDGFDTLICNNGHWSGTDSSISQSHSRQKRFWFFFLPIVVCAFLCGGGGGGGGSNVAPTKYPPAFPDPCAPPEIQSNYNVGAGESGVVVTWTGPVATDRDSGSPSVKQTSGGKSGETFEGAVYGKTHHITYKAEDNDGLTDHCSFSFTVTVLTCEVLEYLENGDRTCENNNIIGSSCNNTCKAGYQLNGPDTVTCQNETAPSWTEIPTCEKIKCAEPTPEGSIIIQCTDQSYSYQSTCTLQCELGWSLDGPTYIQCQADGTWSNEGLTTCKDGTPPSLSCLSPQVFYADRAATSTSVSWQVPSAVDNIDPQPSIIQTNGLILGTVLEVGIDVVTYKALDEGGNESPECTIELHVEEKVCGHPADTFSGTFLSFDCESYVYGASCNLSCLANLPLEGTDLITCESNHTSTGYWDWGSGQKPYCKEISCPELDAPINGAVVYDTILTRPVYTLMCNEKYDIPLIKSFYGNFFCTDNGAWTPFDNVPNCIEPRDPRFSNLPAEVFYYSGDCGTDGTMAQIEGQFQYIFENHLTAYYKAVCPAGETCLAENIVVRCGPIAHTRKRRMAPSYHKSQTRTHQQNENWVEHHIDKRQDETHVLVLQFNIVVEMVFGNVTFREVIRKYDDIQLNILKPAVQDLINNGTFDIDGFVLRDDSFQTAVYGDLECDPGYILDGEQCKPCPSGYFVNETTLFCEACPTGQYSTDVSVTACFDCPAGYSTKRGTATSENECIKLCSPGSYSPDTMESCSPCLHGYYQDEYGQTSCKQCPSGTTTESLNSTSRSDCKNFDVYITEINDEVTLSSFSSSMSSFTMMFWSKRFDGRQSDVVLRLTSDGSDLVVIYLTDVIRIEIPSLLDEIVGSHSSSSWSHVALSWDTVNARVTIYIRGTAVYTSDLVSAPSQPLVQNGVLSLSSNGETGIYLSGFHLLENVLDAGDIALHASSCDETVEGNVVDMGAFAGITQSGQGITVISTSTCNANDECMSSPCNGHLCTDGVDSYTCTCLNGWSGTTCTIPPDFCADAECENGATCESGDTSYTCTCAPGFSGSLCEIDPADGGWSDWTLWSECSASCGSGTSSRTRTCNSPAPGTYGNNCIGDATEVASCNIETCQVCEEFNIPDGTLLDCATDQATGTQTCDVNCEAGKILPPGSEEFQTYTCGPDTGYSWESMDNLPTCVDPTGPNDATITTSINYPSLIPDESKQSAVDAISRNLEATNCHSSSYCDYEVTITEYTCNGQLCSSVNVVLSGSMDEGAELGYDQYVTDGTVSGALEELNNTIADIELSAAYIQDNINGVFGIEVDGISYTPETDTLLIAGLLECAPGQVVYSGFCVECPAGTYLIYRSCVFCEKGSYQPSTGQTSCLACSSGQTTSAIGSTDISKCEDDYTTESEEDDEDEENEEETEDSDKDAYQKGLAIGFSVSAFVISFSVFFFVTYVKFVRPRSKLHDNPKASDTNTKTRYNKKIPNELLPNRSPTIVSISEVDVIRPSSASPKPQSRVSIKSTGRESPEFYVFGYTCVDQRSSTFVNYVK